MHVELLEDAALADIEVTIRCPKAEGEALRLFTLLNEDRRKLTGMREEETFLLEAGDILYIDTVDRRTFLYTKEAVYESPLRLYELLERLECRDFLRAGKSSIINLRQVQSLRPEFGGRLRCTMANGEVLLVSRQYVPSVKEHLGI